MKTLILLAGSLAIAIPASAQDYDPSMAAFEATSQTQHTTQASELSKGLMRNSTRGRAATSSGVRGSASKSARTCANLPAARARLGGDDPRIMQLTKLCKRAGY